MAIMSAFSSIKLESIIFIAYYTLKITNATFVVDRRYGPASTRHRYPRRHTAFDFREVQTTLTVTTINSLSNYTFRFDRTTDNTYSQTNYTSQPVPLLSLR